MWIAIAKALLCAGVVVILAIAAAAAIAQINKAIRDRMGW